MASCSLDTSIVLEPDGRKEDGEHAVEHDHQENRFHYRCSGLQAKRLRAALDLEPFTACDRPDYESHERGLDHANLKMVDRDRLFQARDENLRAHAAIEPGSQAAAIERGH